MKISLSLGLFLFTLSACQSYQINPGSERIRVFETEPKGCIYVGEISSVQEEVVEGKVEPEMSLQTRIDLRNKAHALGGNILIFMKGKDKKVGSVYSALPEASKKSTTGSPAPVNVFEDKEKKVSTTFLATTFRCPASIVNQ
ncbi:MAG: DUF4156 domain-containing protein [Bdellovibrionaceae bacterium]|nr:DUF4156 domain-containing protein [Bdellovibrio sp.]